MKNRHLSAHSLRTILWLCTPLMLLLSNLYVLATPAYVRYEYSKPTFPPADIYEPQERQSLAEASVYYLRSNEGIEYLQDLQSQGQPVYNTRELKHMQDVKVVMTVAFRVQELCALLVLATLALAWHAGQWPLALRAVYQGCRGFVTALVAVGCLAYVSFDSFFTAFHRVFFSGDSWLFAYTDTLIQLFPVPFWMDATWGLVLFTLVECLVVGTVAYFFARRQGRTP